ncbi:MAG: Holliday junction branch migration protein RuvA [Pseudomonadota bacterium]
MIGRLHGKLLVKQPPALLVDVGGVGYEVVAPMSTFYVLPGLEKTVTLHTHLIVREDAQVLYGFATEQERALFRSLIKVNGVGPKLALTILSGISADDFVNCVHDNDVATLVRLPGIGKKTAERLIIEMRDRFKDWHTSSGEFETGFALPVKPEGDGAVNEALSALVALGYKPQEASRLLEPIKNKGMSSEELIRAALQSAVR